MHPHPSTNQSNAGANRPILFISARLLNVQSPTVGIAICGPGKNADEMTPGRVSTTTPPTILDVPQEAAPR